MLKKKKNGCPVSYDSMGKKKIVQTIKLVIITALTDILILLCSLCYV